jgi:hypothetical protein
MLSNAKPNVPEEVTRRMEKFEKGLENCAQHKEMKFH